jgi:hypothetical protein
MFQDIEAKAFAMAECDKRNAVISRFHPMRWKPLFSHGRGWFPALRIARIDH